MRTVSKEFEAPYLLKRALLREVREHLLPWAQYDGVRQITLARLPLRVAPTVAARPFAVNRAEDGGINWRQMGMHPMRYPYLGIVVEGEADLRIGFDPATTARRKNREAHAEPPGGEPCHLLSLPQGAGILYPPGSLGDGRCAHWWRPHPEKAFARIAWLQITPAGAFCHFCVTRGLDHPKQPCAFLPDTRAQTLMEMLIEELTRREAGFERAAQYHLLALLTRLERALLPLDMSLASDEVKLPLHVDRPAPAVPGTGPAALRRACHYIETNLESALTPALVAQHAFISPTHLNRLFRLELGMPIMRYVTQCRMEAAKRLLAETDLPIGEIARLAGYSHLANFTRAFSEWVTISPLAYRKAQAVEASAIRLARV